MVLPVADGFFKFVMSIQYLPLLFWMRWWILILPFVMIILVSCQDYKKDGKSIPHVEKNTPDESIPGLPFSYEGITELQKGDFIVKPNLNILPGTSLVPNGYFFGHAAIIIKGATHEDADSLLSGAILIESTARDLPPGSQIRETAGYGVRKNPVLHNDSFGPAFRGRRYRLRLNLTDSQIDSIIAFIAQQKNDTSTWAAQKSYPGNPLSDSLVNIGHKKNWADNSYWYCSLLIWQSVLYVTGIDLDPNGGHHVYPNDLINSPYFNNTTDGIKRRVRF